MIIVREIYTLTRTNWEYTLAGRGTSSVGYRVYRVRNNVRTKIADEVLQADDSVKLPITDTDIFDLDVYVADNTWETIDIRNFNELKQGIITTMQDALCDCENLDASTCGLAPSQATQMNLNNLQLLYNSVLAYRNQLLSKTFLRPTDAAIIDTFGSMSVQLLGDLNQAYLAVEGRGTPDSTVALLRKYTGIMYIIFFAIEYDIATFVDYEGINNPGDPAKPPEETAPPDAPSPAYRGTVPDATFTSSGIPEIDPNASQEVKDIYSWFGLDTTTAHSALQKCFSEACLDSGTIYDTFYNLYVRCSIDTNTCDSPVTPPPSEHTVYDLTYNNWSSPVASGQQVVVTTFSWKVTGAPINLKLSDSTGQLQNVPVSGLSYSPPTALVYTEPSARKVIWTITSDNAGSDTLQTDWAGTAYWGRRTTFMPPIPNTNEILAGNQLTFTAGAPITFNPNVTAGQYCWCAVPVEDTPLYRIWATEKSSGGVEDTGPIGDLRAGGVSSQTFVCLSDTVMLNGIPHYFYAQNIQSVIQTNLTLGY